eukprot:UN15350
MIFPKIIQHHIFQKMKLSRTCIRNSHMYISFTLECHKYFEKMTCIFSIWIQIIKYD